MGGTRIRGDHQAGSGNARGEGPQVQATGKDRALAQACQPAHPSGPVTLLRAPGEHHAVAAG